MKIPSAMNLGAIATGGAIALLAAIAAPSAKATTLTGFQTNGAQMGGMNVTVNFLGGTSDSAIWSPTGGVSGAASGSDWSLSQSGDTFSDPWSFSYSGLGTITSLIIDAVPGNTVFDIGTNPSTPGSAGGREFDFQSGLNPSSFEYSVPIDISTGDLFGTLSLFWDGGFTANNSLQFRADTDSGSPDDPVTPRDVPEPTALLGLLAIGMWGGRSALKNKMS